MSTKQNWNNLGDQYKTTVQDAIHTGDFTKLNRLVSDTVSDAIAEASWQVKHASEGIQREIQNKPAPPKPQPKTTTLPIAKTKKIGQVSSILYITFGSIGIASTCIAGLIGLILTIAGFTWPALTFLFLILLFFICIMMIRKGAVERGRLSRMRRYVALFGQKMYMNIEDLAKHTHKSVSYVLKDIKKMLKLGFFPEGHLDNKGTCLMLDDATYREYLRVEQERSRLALEESTRQKQEAAMTSKKNTKPVNPELQVMITEGQSYIQKLHTLNDLIEGEVISDKMYRMENLLKEIFKRLEETPDQMPKMHKLMNYYLPTTIKLLEAYSKYDNISTPGPDILSAKAEIEKTVDTINEAFTELLNKLFQADVFDVTTDAQVLQTMLAKEGLTKNKFTEDTPS